MTAGSADVLCPRCGHLGPLDGATTEERSVPLGATGGILEIAGVGLLSFGQVALGLVIMLAGGALVLANIRTPRGSCGFCKAAFAQDWKGSWFPKV